MDQDLEIDDLIGKLVKSEQNIKQIRKTKTTIEVEIKRKKFIEINKEKKDIFISMSSENEYKEFEKWLLIKI